MRSMTFPASALIVSSIYLTPTSSLADDSGFFFGADGGAAFRFGYSDTTEGGSQIGGGGTVYDVSFDTAWQAGGHVGYRISRALAFFVSYERIEGDVSWKVNFQNPAADQNSRFSGEAISNLVLANVAYTPFDTGATSLDLTLGAGFAINQLNDVVEGYADDAFFLADNTEVSPAAELGIAVRHEVVPWLHLGVDAVVAYYGGFETGNSRIWQTTGEKFTVEPYEIDPVWGASVGGFVRLSF